MPSEIVTNHANEEVDILVDLGVYSEPSNIDDINDLLGSVLSSANTEVESTSKLFGNCNVSDGGLIGSLLSLSRSHIEASVRNGELTKSDVGKVYASILPQAIQSAIAIYDSGIKNEIAKRESNLNAAMLSVELSKSLSDAELNYYKMLTEKYSLQSILPLDRELKKEQLEDMHIQHAINKYKLDTDMPLVTVGLDKQNTLVTKDIDTKSYNLETILPLDASLKSKDIDTKAYTLETMLPTQVDDMIAKKNISIKDLELKEFNLTEIMPKELAIKESQVIINAKEADIKQYELVNTLPTQNAFTVAQRLKVEADTDAVELDIQIKDYYKNNIQVFERDLSEYKAIQEGVNSGSIVDRPDSLPAKRMDQLVVQTDLYTRQKDHYNDIVNQKLLDTIMNYNAMIFPDNTSPDKLIGWAAYTDNSENVAKALSPEINTPPS